MPDQPARRWRDECSSGFFDCAERCEPGRAGIRDCEAVVIRVQHAALHQRACHGDPQPVSLPSKKRLGELGALVLQRVVELDERLA